MDKLNLNYTGHPFVDIGIAAITAFADKLYPTELTTDDLEAVARYIETQYVRPPLRGHLTMAFTANGWFIQDAYNPDKPGLSPEESQQRMRTRQEWADRHLRQWQTTTEQVSDERCIFTGLPAITVALSGKLPVGRVGRSQIPMLQGDDSINFYAYGSPGLPISGLALLALQFFPMGCAKAGDGLLAVHSDRPDLTYALALHFWRQNHEAVFKAQAAGLDKLPSAQRSLKTLLVEALIEAQRRRQKSQKSRDDGDEELPPASLTAYNFNNGKSPNLTIYQLPLEIVSFIEQARSATYAAAWDRLIQRGWQLTSNIPMKGKAKASPDEQPRRNYLYEDLFELVNQPDKIKRFVRTYFLRVPQRTADPTDPRHAYRLYSELNLIDWPLIILFLGRVVHMDRERIRQIAEFGDRLAIYTRSEGGKRFFRNFFTEQKPQVFRALLIKANIAHIKAGYPPIFNMEGYIEVFEEGDELMRSDWRFARDLVLMRMIDQLRDWLAVNSEVLLDESGEPTAVE